ncbi:MAG: trehalose-phosphatase [Bacteroidota bacterium]|jgi:trehalose-phosphatase|nr:trehalose-phosphatase [Bacteroidota bacterium]
MNILNSDIDLPEFFTRVRDATQRLLLLDYDGTLAPFTTDRGAARPYPEITPLLEALITHPACRTVLISGRSVEDLRALLPFDSVPEIWGSHGWEHLRADGRMIPPTLPRTTARVLAEEWAWLTASVPAHLAERKPASVAVHWRGLDAETQIVLRALALRRWRAPRMAEGLELHPFDGGLELRASGRNKGDAVRALLGEYDTPPATAYLGDDATDEDAFAALTGSGLRVLVRPQPRETRADVHLVPPDELHWFLEQWRQHL